MQKLCGFYNRHGAKLKWAFMIIIVAINIICLRTVGLKMLNMGQPVPLASSPEASDTTAPTVKTGVLNFDFLSKADPAQSPKINRTGLKELGAPIQHVYYLKIHKTGSSTIFAIMAEYSRCHDLLPLLPVHEHINLAAPLIPSKQLMLSPKVKVYDMVFNHHVYQDSLFKFLHNDTFKIATLREPFRHFVSSIMYFKANGMGYLQKLNKYKDPITAFLTNINAFETTGYQSYTNNRQSVDLGFSVRKESFRNEQYIDHFIAETERRFDLILIVEYFMESIVLMRRALNWQTQDILYYVKNAYPKGQAILANMTDWHRARHSEFSQPDIRLYQHFLAIFKQRMARAVGLQEEIAEMQIILEKVRNFCNEQKAHQNSGKESIKILRIPPGRWSSEVSVTKSKCIWLQLEELTVTKNLQTIQKIFLQKS